ncbi:ABC transporter substrate-binding protein [Paracidovorax avenae]|uniref:ABC transporter substrate-binding protein n=1 Tax=Paracidovorax avenae TaxID=80867 RepID=UPI000D2114FD|nr:ABC transporter substrate-binding protein [Paracidovorax avenae]AVT11656.1 amino acid ABC transporter substrate-binding protein [Paracidovorax avenae]
MPLKNAIRSAGTFVFAAVLGFVALSAGATQVDDIRKKGELVCGVLGTDEPFSFMKDPASREIVGYEVDICKAVAKSLGVKPVLKQIAVAARLAELQQGRVDMLTATLTHSRERETQIDFSVSTFITGQKVMVKKTSGIRHLSDLNGKKVLTVKGSSMEQNVRKAAPSAEIVSFDAGPQALLALQQGKGVAYANDETSLVSQKAMLGDAAQNYEILPENLSVEHIAVGIRKGQPELRDQVNQVLRGMEASGEAEKLFMKWFGPTTKMRYEVRPFKMETDRIDPVPGA